MKIPLDGFGRKENRSPFSASLNPECHSVDEAALSFVCACVCECEVNAEIVSKRLTRCPGVTTTRPPPNPG